MRRVFDRITERLQRFIWQRDNVALAVQCRDTDCVAILKILEGLDEGSSSELYWHYLGDFIRVPEYVNEVVEDFAAKHEGVRLAMGRKEMKPWPPLPPQLLDESRVPVQRLRELMAFSRSLLPQPEGCLVVWVLFPLQLADPIGYGELMRELLLHEYPFPWFHHIRLILREDTATSLADMPRIDHYTPDLSDEALEKALEEEAADEEVPLTDLIQAMFISAHRDYAYGRFDEALKKHEVIVRYHTAIGNAPVVALALNSVGEIHQRLGRLEQAGRCFEAALEPACEGDHPPLPALLNILLNLANLRMDQTRFAESEVYYDAAEKVATVQRNPAAKIQSIENLGYSQYMQGKVNEAEQSWRHGAMIADKLGQPELRKSLLVRLRHHYGSTNQVAKQREIEMQLASLNLSPVN